MSPLPFKKLTIEKFVRKKLKFSSYEGKKFNTILKNVEKEKQEQENFIP